MKNLDMKNYKFLSILLFVGMMITGLVSCKKDNGTRVPVSDDQSKPGH
jgi:hypothetical protein